MLGQRVEHRDTLGSDPGDDLHRTQGRHRHTLSQVEKTGLRRAIQLVRPRFDLLHTDSEEEIRTIGRHAHGQD
jgi:hypothetical protein